MIHSGHEALCTAAQHLQGQAVVRKNFMPGWKIEIIFALNNGEQAEPLNKHISGRVTARALCIGLQCMTGGPMHQRMVRVEGTLKITWIQPAYHRQGHPPLAQIAQIHVGGNIYLI